MKTAHRPSVIVTGASAGVGRATALAFARRGWAVGLLARGPERLASAARDVTASGGEALVLQADVADATAVDAAAEKARAAFGRLDVWVNNAMATVYGRVVDLTPDEFRRVTEVTYLGQVHGTQAALRVMREQRQGVIVQVGSALAYRSIPLQAAYCAAKAAVRGLTDALRSELIREGSDIRLTMVQLPAVDTPQFDWARNHLGERPQPVPPVYDPDTIAEAIVEAALRPRRETWIGAATAQAILGTMIAPGLMDRYMARRARHGQTTGERDQPHADNLFDPPAGDPGVGGRFADRAARRVATFPEPVLRASAVGLLLTIAGSIAAAGYLAGRRSKPRRAPTSVAQEHAARLVS
jgi:NAD(P)-dependent dehydrogenase (short-subunit alcohol dehydrogenase family)